MKKANAVCRTSCFIGYANFTICTSSQGDNERWQLISKLTQFTAVLFSDLNPNSHDKQHEIRLKYLNQGQI